MLVICDQTELVSTTGSDVTTVLVVQRVTSVGTRVRVVTTFVASPVLVIVLTEVAYLVLVTVTYKQKLSRCLQLPKRAKTRRLLVWAAQAPGELHVF